MNEHGFENIISQDLESLGADELLAMSESLVADSCPDPTEALDAFKRDYLPAASETSLYDAGTKPVRRSRINLKHIVAVAAVAALIGACSLVSYAAGVASTENKNPERVTQEAAQTEEEPLKTNVKIDGKDRELYVIKPVDEVHASNYISVNSLGNEEFLSATDRIYSGSYHFADLDGNVLEFERIISGEKYDELYERLKQKSIEMYGTKFIEDIAGYLSGMDLGEFSDFICRRYEAGDYYFEYFKGANYEIVSRDPFTRIYDKLYVNCETNFQMETQVIMYADCYNPEKGTYQEFISSKTAIGSFEVVFDIPEGWMLVDGKIIVQNHIIGKNMSHLTAYSNDEAQSAAELASFRKKLNEALDRYYQEKVERNDVIEKIEEGQNS